MRLSDKRYRRVSNQKGPTVAAVPLPFVRPSTARILEKGGLMVNRQKICRVTLLLTAASTLPSLAIAQDSAQPAGELSADPGEIVVTARKRDETAISVPVVLSAIGQKELQSRAVNNLEGIARIVPQLVIGQADGGIQGGTISLRGITSGDANPFADTAVSFNIDGAQVARGSVQRMAQMDIAQVEVLKGPQALYFGKNSPGGIIVIRTNDPTDHIEAGGSLGYEFTADELRGDAYLSGPLTDNLGARLAVYGSTMRGWSTNLAPTTGITGIQRDRLPHDREIAGRLTIKFVNGGPFDTRLKLAYNRLQTDGPGENSSLSIVLSVLRSLVGPNECKADNRVVRAEPGPNFVNVDPRFGAGLSFLHQRQILGSLEMNYALSDQFKLTSVSSLYE